MGWRSLASGVLRQVTNGVVKMTSLEMTCHPGKPLSKPNVPKASECYALRFVSHVS